MDSQITINISITPEGLKIARESSSEAATEYPIPPVPQDGSTIDQASIVEDDFTPPVPEGAFVMASSQPEIPDLPEE